jgi:hypothetical protein
MNKIGTINGVSPLCDKNNADLFLLSYGLPTSRDWAIKTKTPAPEHEQVPLHKRKRNLSLVGIKCNPENAHSFLKKFGFSSKIDVKNAIRTRLGLK